MIRAAIALLAVLLLLCSWGWGACFQSDVRAMCCPSACAVLRSPRWYDADRTLTACARSLGCYNNDRKLNTRMVCSCP